MTLPVGAAGGSLPVQSAPSPPSRHGGIPQSGHFGEVLGERGVQPGPALDQTQRALGPARGRAAQPAAAHAPTRIDGVTARSSAEAPPALRQLLVRLVEGEDRADAVIRAALSGRDFTIQETIAIQAAVLKHAQEIEAVSRVLDRLTGALKGALQTQV